jgi:hypothetical protein
LRRTGLGLCLRLAAFASPRNASPTLMATSTPRGGKIEADMIVSSLDLTLLASALSLTYSLISLPRQCRAVLHRRPPPSFAYPSRFFDRPEKVLPRHKKSRQVLAVLVSVLLGERLDLSPVNPKFSKGSTGTVLPLWLTALAGLQLLINGASNDANGGKNGATGQSMGNIQQGKT